MTAADVKPQGFGVVSQAAIKNHDRPTPCESLPDGRHCSSTTRRDEGYQITQPGWVGWHPEVGQGFDMYTYCGARLPTCRRTRP